MKQAVPLLFTDGPCRDDEPEWLRDMRRQFSLQARKQRGDVQLDHLLAELFYETADLVGVDPDDFTQEDDDLFFAIARGFLLDYCTGALFGLDDYFDPRIGEHHIN